MANTSDLITYGGLSGFADALKEAIKNRFFGLESRLGQVVAVYPDSNHANIYKVDLVALAAKTGAALGLVMNTYGNRPAMEYTSGGALLSTIDALGSDLLSFASSQSDGIEDGILNPLNVESTNGLDIYESERVTLAVFDPLNNNFDFYNGKVEYDIHEEVQYVWGYTVNQTDGSPYFAVGYCKDMNSLISDINEVQQVDYLEYTSM